MISIQDRYLDQARRNRDHAEWLLGNHADDPTCVQWAVTAVFYCAVHCMQAYLLGRGVDPRSHVARAHAMAATTNGVPANVQDAVEALKQYSEKARYRLGIFDPAYVRRRMLEGELRIITDFVGL